MIVKVNGVTLPIEAFKPEPILVEAAVSDGNASVPWSQLRLRLDTAADITTLPLPLLKKILGDNLVLGAPVDMRTAEGNVTKVPTAKISLRIKAQNQEVITIQDLDCCAPEKGDCLLGLEAQSIFRIILSRNSLQELTLCPKVRTWLNLE